MQRDNLSLEPADPLARRLIATLDAGWGTKPMWNPFLRPISQKFPENFREDRGASMDNIVNVLRYRGLLCYNKGAGAHATLCTCVYKDDHRCVCLDPAYGLVELSGSQPPANAPK